MENFRVNLIDPMHNVLHNESCLQNFAESNCNSMDNQKYRVPCSPRISLSYERSLMPSVFSIQELYAYSARVRGRFAEKLTELSWEQCEKNREASFYSMKNILLHMIDNEDWIVNWIIQGRAAQCVRRKSDEYTSMAMVLKHLDEVQQKTKSYLAGADEEELSRRFDVKFTSGTFNLSVEELLFQSFTEQLYHIGELIGLLWQENVEPPRMQWFWNNPRSTS
jgi:uncharacterized damage-inducible protein DinB